MQPTRSRLILLTLVVLGTTAFASILPPFALALPEGRTYDQAHDSGYLDWSGPVQYLFVPHRDGSSLPPEEGGASCQYRCDEWVTYLGTGGTVLGSFDRDIAYFEVMLAFTHDDTVGTAILQACSSVSTSDLYLGPGSGLPGFISVYLPVPAGCRSWSLSAQGGYVLFRSTDVIYNAASPSATPPPPTRTSTPTRTRTPAPTRTLTRTPTRTPSPASTATRTSTAAHTPSHTFTPTNTATFTSTATLTHTFTPTSTPTFTPTHTFTPTSTPTFTPTHTYTPTSTPTFTPTHTFTPTSTSTFTPTHTFTPTSTPTFTPTHTFTPTSTATFTPTPTSTPLPPQVTGRLVCSRWGNAGWCRGELALDLTAGDPQGFEVIIRGDWNGVPFTCGDACLLPLPEGIGTAHYTAISSSGQTASGSATWQRDATPPDLDLILPTPEGRSGWHISGVTVSAEAVDSTSGLDEVRVSRDEGNTWEALPIQLADGVHPIAVRARDVAGNETLQTEVIQVDTLPPVTCFTAPAAGEVVRGRLELTGTAQDETSGVAVTELSFDAGLTWQAASDGEREAWSHPWDSHALPNGYYLLMARSRDGAGHVGAAVQVTLLLDNQPPQVWLAERWWIWEAGDLRVSPNTHPIAKVEVTLRDAQARWPSVVLEFDPDKIPTSITWDRRFADGTLAPAGEYQVLAEACDVYGVCGRDTGVIVVPLMATATPSPTVSPTVFIQVTPSATRTQVVVPPTPIPVIPPTEADPEAKPLATPFLLWQLTGLLGLMLALASTSLIDPRPAALRRLEGFIRQMTNRNDMDSSQEEPFESKGK
ncbi:MAG: hypothetical protein ACOYYJ_14975 [Chloroflexota bacterium]